MQKVLLVSLAVLMIGCGKGGGSNLETQSQPLPPINTVQDSIVVKSRATLTISTGAVIYGKPQVIAQSVSVVNSPSSSISLSTDRFVEPAISNASLSFGYIALSNVFDNDLNRCGPGGNEHCGKALIRIYTTGVAGSGYYNAVEDYSATMYANHWDETEDIVGLNAANALTVHEIAIPSTQTELHLSDFVNPYYDIEVDFTDAPTGSYQTTIVVEFALAQ